MPSHYRYLWQDCGAVEERHLNAVRCGVGRGPLVHLADNSPWGGLQPEAGERLLDWLVALTGRAG